MSDQPTSASFLNTFLPIITLIIGFLLGEGARYLHYRWEIHQNKEIIKTELETILAMIPQKKETLLNAITSLKNQRLLNTTSIHITSTGYKSVFNNLYPHLNLLERSCLHAIYETLQITDRLMDSLENDFTKALKEKIVADPWTGYIDRLGDLLESYERTEPLIKSYLAGNPPNVFNLQK